MIIALASPRIATSLDDGLERIDRLAADAASRGAEIVCFPEAYLPGLRGLDFGMMPRNSVQSVLCTRSRVRTISRSSLGLSTSHQPVA
jgi:predicted amidohydrolase